MFKKLLIANRGEIAVRIIQSCKELNIKTVAIYSKEDKYSQHVELADEAYCIGSESLQQCYLDMFSIINTAIISKCDAVHPGYGFLSENAKFAELCENHNITFIGPSSDIISKMGQKDEAKNIMKKNGVPIVPGSIGIIETIEEAEMIASEIGYPLIIKASAGGGGKGIKIVKSEEDLLKGLKDAQQEASNLFGNSDVYIEKYIEDFRHIEIQVLADNFDNTIHLGERDCTIQRRMQKLIEESPSPLIDKEMREDIGNSAVKAARAAGYVNAGTVEFIFDYNKKKYYFMEMNTRIQVEHPVTEMLTGVDLIKEQINIATGNKLTLSQTNIIFDGHVIECRINAEDPQNDFMPSPGTLKAYRSPGGMGVRVDTAVFKDYTILPYYDSMIAKVIVHGRNREEAISKMQRTLEEFIVEGVKTTISFQIDILKNHIFKKGKYNTNFIKNEM